MRHHLALSSVLSLSLMLAACGQSDTVAAVHGADAGSGSGAAPAAALAAAVPASGVAGHAAAADFTSDAATLAVGAKLYQQNCFACHDTGAAGAPKRGDKAAWAPRISQGAEVLYQAAIKGINAMPARGGSRASDAEIKAAVDYIVAGSR